MVRQRTGPNVTIARLRHLLARAYVTFARHHRPRLQRIPDIIAAMEQYHVAKHYAASSPIMRTWWTQQRAVRLKGDNQAYIMRVTNYNRRSLSRNRSRPKLVALREETLLHDLVVYLNHLYLNVLFITGDKSMYIYR